MTFDSLTASANPAKHVRASTAPQPAVARQCSLQGTATCAGVGVHSGQPVALRLCPAPTDTGILFIRTDLKNGARAVAARWDKVTETRLCTVISNDHGGTVATIEHLMAALHAFGIDNALVEIDSVELPIMDGTSDAFMQMIESAGIAGQNAPRRAIEILKPVACVQGDKRASLTPAPQARYSVSIDFKQAPIFRQNYDFLLSPTGFKTEIGRARNFGFYEEFEQLRQLGFARGSSLDNTIGIKDQQIMNPEGLRYPDEFVRHKVLDAVGDLALAGAPIRGHFQGERSGHAMNNQLLRALFADPSAWRYTDTGEPTVN